MCWTSRCSVPVPTNWCSRTPAVVLHVCRCQVARATWRMQTARITTGEKQAVHLAHAA